MGATAPPPLIRGRFEPLGEIGRGGQGSVIRALDHRHDRVVALKIRRRPAKAREKALLAEARVLLAVPPHPSIPIVRDDFFDGKDHVLVMDYVEGQNLRERAAAPGGLPVKSVMAWLTDVAEAIDHLHAQVPPVVHGDVKPANIVIQPDDGNALGRAVLVDFGFAGAHDGPNVGATPRFDAPELAIGQRSTASDVYALAASAHQLLSGVLPEPGAEPDWSAIPERARPRVIAAIRAGLAVHPRARPRSAGAFIRGIEEALNLTPPYARLVSWRRSLAVAAAIVLVGDIAALPRSEHPGHRLTRIAAGTPSSPLTSTTSTPSTSLTTTQPTAVVPSPGAAATVTAATVRRVAPLAAPQRSRAYLARIGLYENAGYYNVKVVGFDGKVTDQHANRNLVANWTHIVNLSDGWLYFYRSSDGAGGSVPIDEQGSLAIGANSPANANNVAVVGIGNGAVWMYRSTDGWATTYRFSPTDGKRVDADDYPNAIDAGFDHAAFAGEGRVLLYNSQTGGGVVVTIDGAGKQLLRTRSSLPTGWQLLGDTGTGLIVGLAADGTGELLRADGYDMKVVKTISLGTWTSSVPYRDGIMLRATNGAIELLPIDASGNVGKAISIAAASTSVVSVVDNG